MGYIMNSCYRGDTKISCFRLIITQIRNVSFRISLRWQIHIINRADKAKLSCNTPQRRAQQHSFCRILPFYYNTVGNKYYRFKCRAQLFFFIFLVINN